MKKVQCLLFLAIIALPLFCQKTNPNYDAALADRLKADERGMKMYVLVILKTGENNSTITDRSKRDSLFAGHFANITRLAGQKKLIVAGPLERNDRSYRGIFILDVPDFDEAQKLLSNDPTISNKIFEAEYYQWYGSAALPEYLDAAEKVRKTLP